MLEGDGKPKSINLNRILFFFLCFAFPLNFFYFPRHVTGSASGTFHIRRIFPSFLTHLLQISLLLFFFLLSLQETRRTILSTVMEAHAHIHSSVSLTECAE